MQATSAAEEERIGIDFAALWKERQEKDVKDFVEQHSAVPDGTKDLSFPHAYSRKCVRSPSITTSNLPQLVVYICSLRLWNLRNPGLKRGDCQFVAFGVQLSE
jgi:hypothetical protein